MSVAEGGKPPAIGPDMAGTGKPPVCFRKRAALSPQLVGALRAGPRPWAKPSASGSSASGLGLTIRRRRCRTGAMLRHELVELFLVLGVTQAIEKIPKFGLLFFEAPQGLHAVFVERAVAARRRSEGETSALHAVAHPLHLVLHPLHLVRPAVLMTP